MAKNLYMGKLSVGRQRALCIVTDWATTFIAFFLFNVFRFFYMGLGDDMEDLGYYIFSTKLILEQIGVPIILLFVYWLSGYYNRPFERSRLKELLLTFYSQLYNAVVIYLGALTNDPLYHRRESWFLLLVLFLLLFLFTYFGRLLLTERMIRKLKRKDVKPRTVVIGLSDEAMRMASKMEDSRSKPIARIVAFYPFGNETEGEQAQKILPAALRLKKMEELKALCKEGNIDQIVIVPPVGKSPTKKILYFLYHLYPYEVAIKIKPDIIALITPTIHLDDILDEPLIDLTKPRVSEFSKNIKRALDIFVSGVGMVALSPLYAVLALAVKNSGPGKVIYAQERVGRHRRPFRILKFRSMVRDAEKDGVPRLSSDTDPRITPIGKWMRKYRLDELPQLWNVFKGDMSLVGPRPERDFYIEQIIRKAPWYTLALQVRPGITSWGMVKYGYATDIDQMIERNRYDLVYIANMSVAVDFKILIHTVKTVGAGEGK